jgi:hypothetical protein
MPGINKHIIEKVTDAARIEDVVLDCLGSYDARTNPTGLRKKGVRYTAICPFHDDRHDGNFIVYPKDNCYRCFTCDAKGGPVQFLMAHERLSFPDAIRWLGKKYNIEVDDVPLDYTPPPPRPLPPPLPMLTLPMSMVTAREHTEDDNLCRWLRSLPWDGAQRSRIDNILAEYHIGHSRNGMTIFWQIDEHRKVRTGKMMLYKADGHRDKTARYNFDWIHAALFRDIRHPEYSDEKQECKPTIFGIHLLSTYPKASINIVESEKTAIIMAIAYGNRPSEVWMACGGAENISREKLAPIIKENRRIILYPDRDAIDKWRAKAANLRYDRLTVNVQAVKDWWMPQDGEKADIADVIIRLLTSHTTPTTTVGDAMKNNPAIQKLVEKLNLKPIGNGTKKQ